MSGFVTAEAGPSSPLQSPRGGISKSSGGEGIFYDAEDGAAVQVWIDTAICERFGMIRRIIAEGATIATDHWSSEVTLLILSPSSVRIFDMYCHPRWLRPNMRERYYQKHREGDVEEWTRKVLLKSWWVDKCLEAGRLLSEADDWAGCRAGGPPSNISYAPHRPQPTPICQPTSSPVPKTRLEGHSSPGPPKPPEPLEPREPHEEAEEAMDIDPASSEIEEPLEEVEVRMEEPLIKQRSEPFREPVSEGRIVRVEKKCETANLPEEAAGFRTSKKAELEDVEMAEDVALYSMADDPDAMHGPHGETGRGQKSLVPSLCDLHEPDATEEGQTINDTGAEGVKEQSGEVTIKSDAVPPVGQVDTSIDSAGPAAEFPAELEAADVCMTTPPTAEVPDRSESPPKEELATTRVTALNPETEEATDHEETEDQHQDAENPTSIDRAQTDMPLDPAKLFESLVFWVDLAIPDRKPLLRRLVRGGAKLCTDYPQATHALVHAYQPQRWDAIIRDVVKQGVWFLQAQWAVKCLDDGVRHDEYGWHVKGGAPPKTRAVSPKIATRSQFDPKLSTDRIVSILRHDYPKVANGMGVTALAEMLATKYPEYTSQSWHNLIIDWRRGVGRFAGLADIRIEAPAPTARQGPTPVRSQGVSSTRPGTIEPTMSTEQLEKVFSAIEEQMKTKLWTVTRTIEELMGQHPDLYQFSYWDKLLREWHQKRGRFAHLDDEATSELGRATRSPDETVPSKLDKAREFPHDRSLGDTNQQERTNSRSHQHSASLVKVSSPVSGVSSTCKRGTQNSLLANDEIIRIFEKEEASLENMSRAALGALFVAEYGTYTAGTWMNFYNEWKRKYGRFAYLEGAKSEIVPITKRQPRSKWMMSTASPLKPEKKMTVESMEEIFREYLPLVQDGMTIATLTGILKDDHGIYTAGTWGNYFQDWRRRRIEGVASLISPEQAAKRPIEKGSTSRAKKARNSYTDEEEREMAQYIVDRLPEGTRISSKDWKEFGVLHSKRTIPAYVEHYRNYKGRIDAIVRELGGVVEEVDDSVVVLDRRSPRSEANREYVDITGLDSE